MQPSPAPRIALLATLLAAAGCDDFTGPSGFEFLVQVRAVSQPTAPGGQTAPARAEGVERIDIQEAVVVLSGLTLDGSSRTNTLDWTLDQTVVVPLRLGGDATLAFAPAAAEGEYEGLRIAVEELNLEDPDEAELIDAFPRMEALSVLVSGEILRNGVLEEFIFTTAATGTGELVFRRPRTFSAESAAIAVYTVLFDLDRWFETAGGILLDPNDPADREAIEASILGTMELVSGSG